MDAMLAPASAVDAKNRNRFGVVRIFLRLMKERRVREIANMEQPAPIRSMVMSTSIWSAVRAESPVSGDASMAVARCSGRSECVSQRC